MQANIFICLIVFILLNYSLIYMKHVKVQKQYE